MSTEVKPTDWDAEDNRWEPTPSGGGSGLPSFTSADKGKVLTIGEGEGSETTVIVPEQTVTLTIPEEGQLPDPAVLIGADFSSVSVGTVALMSVNGVTRTVTAVDPLGNGGIIFPFGDENNTAILRSAITGDVKFGSDAAGTYTVSLSASVPSVEPKWEAAGGGIVDIALGTRTAANGADNAIYVNGQELTTLEECATYLESVKNNVLRVYFLGYPEGVTSIYAVTGILVYRTGNMAYGEFMQKLPQTGEINVQTFGYMPASD